MVSQWTTAGIATTRQPVSWQAVFPCVTHLNVVWICFLLQGELGDIGLPGPPIVIDREGVVISGTCLHFVLELIQSTSSDPTFLLTIFYCFSTLCIDSDPSLVIFPLTSVLLTYRYIWPHVYHFRVHNKPFTPTLQSDTFQGRVKCRAWAAVCEHSGVLRVHLCVCLWCTKEKWVLWMLFCYHLSFNVVRKALRKWA